MSTYKYTINATEALNRGFFVDKNNLELIKTGSISNLIFGNQPEDVIETSFYNSNNELISYNVNDGDVKSTQFNRSYFDTNGNLISYSFNILDSKFFTISDADQVRSVVVSPVDDAKKQNLQPGNYKISYTLLNNVIGSVNEKLKISFISPSRTEITAIPNAKPADKKLINKQFNKVLNDSIFTREIIDSIISKTREKRIDEIYLNSKDNNERLVTEIKLLYALPRDIDVINFLTEILQGTTEADKTLFYQFENWLFSQFDNENTFDNIRSFYNTTVDELIRFSLIKKSTVVPAEFNEIVLYLKSLFDDVFLISIFESEKLYFDRNNLYLKHVLNFGNDVMFPVANYIGTGQNVNLDNRYQPLAIKLTEPLPEEYSVGDTFVFSRLVTNPVFNDFILYQNVKIEKISIAGPNFTVNSENLFSTKTYSLDDIAPSGSLNTLLSNENKKAKKINIDYTSFENFVKFSSAKSRVRNYERKLQQINDIDDEISIIESKLDNIPNDPYLLSDLGVKNREISDIKQKFDDYESFLFNNPEWYVQHSSPIGETARNGTFETSASLFDKFNDSSMVSNTPDFIIEDSENSEYVEFLNMVGQMFDDIWIHIENTPTISMVDNADNIGLSDEMVKTMLQSLGWNPESGTDAADLLSALTGEDEHGNIIEEIPGKKRTRLIWKRILNNLPYILKTKGSEEAVRALFTCYGIPRSLYSIREFGGIRKIDKTKDDNLYIFDNDYYALHFDGQNEYIKCPWDDDIQTVEFKFAFDTNKTFNEGEIFRLAVLDERWVIGATRERGSSWGKVFFTLADATGSSANISTLMTEKLPIFNGDLFTVILRRNDIENYFGFTEEELEDSSFVDLLPIRYDLIVKRAIDDRIVFEDEVEYHFTGSYNTNFRASGSTEYVHFGNYTQLTGSLIPDPEAFYGVIDQVRFWKTPLSNKRIDSHVYFINGFDTDFPDNTQNNLKLHLNFNQPQNLYSGSVDAISGSVYIPNNSLSGDKLGSIQAINFPDLSSTQNITDTYEIDCCEQLPEVFQYVSASFPWHFKKFQTRELVKIPDYGAAKFRSNNVNYITQELEKPLFYDSRTTKPASKVKTKGSNGLGVFFSPTDDLNTRIIEFFGDFDVSDFIGDPREIYNDQYKKFKIFKLNFYKTGLGNVDFQSYVNLVKSYFDCSLFKHLKTIVPAKSTFRTGILIEPSILERDKVKARATEREIHNNLETQTDVIREKSADLIFGRSLNGNPLEDGDSFKTGSTTQYPRNFYTFVNDQPDMYGMGIYADNGVVYKNGQRFYAEIIKENKTLYRFDDSVSNNNYVPVTQSFESINLIPFTTGSLSMSLSFPDSRVLKGYDKRHFKFKRNFFGRISTQDEFSTIDPESGVPDGSEVVELTTVDRGRVNVGTQGEGVVLDSDS